MTGSDGRLYDSHYDYDNDGKLDAYERAMYDDSFKSDYSYSSKQSPFTLLYHCGGLTEIIATIIWLFGFICMIAFPPLGALIIIGAVTLTERK